jgi:hypothetical protein
VAFHFGAGACLKEVKSPAPPSSQTNFKSIGYRDAGAFWSIWRLFYPRILTLAKRDKRWHESSEIIGNYLLAWSYWKEEAREWHSLRDRERQFFKQAAAEMGGRPSVFYSIVKTS